MNKIVNKTLIILIVLGIFIPGVSFARTNITDWYLKDFRTEIVVNKDSTLTITESILADCDNLPNKHGIFRILPTQIQTNEGVIKTPIELISITDFFGTPLKYTTIRDAANHTITFKIGDPDVVVRGENQYRIKYKVKNAIRFNNQNFDELYWNLNGNFWEIETDIFVATLKFPQEINKENATVDYYTGYLGAKSKDLAIYRWINANTLEFYAIKTLLAKQGITASITFPKNIFTPYKLSFSDKYGEYLGFLNFWYLLPILVFVLCFILWRKYGRDPHLHKTIVPEFEIPENLRPIQMGGLMSNTRFENKFTTATLVDLAVRGFISISEIEGSFFKKKNYLLKILKADYSKNQELSETEKAILDWLFMGRDEISLSEIREERMLERRGKFLKIAKALKDDLIGRGLIAAKGLGFQAGFMACGFIGLFGGILLHSIPIVVSAFILIIFSFIMPQRTQKGAELLWRIKGFKLYMSTAEKYRQQFNEKENIFEKLLPYAIIFNITKEWVKKMQDIYGEDYFKNYHPIWFTGASMASFDADSFTSHLNGLSSSISSNVGGASGAGGAGGAGGGGGGGVGGGW